MEEIKIFPDSPTLTKAVSEHFIQIGNHAILMYGRFVVAMAGGSTPEAAYLLLSTRPFASQIDWSRVHFFWGDERCVPPDHIESNFQMASEALINHISIPSSNIHRMEGEIEPTVAADRYQKKLEAFFGSRPHFDLILLGLGTDGHTASLFPGTNAIHENVDWVVANYIKKLDTWRITLTPRILNQAHNIAFIVSGENKAIPLKAVLGGDYQPDVYPSQIIRPTNGKLVWLIDKTAAKLLK
jgi:6-phosphogluconolactonase